MDEWKLIVRLELNSDNISKCIPYVFIVLFFNGRDGSSECEPGGQWRANRSSGQWRDEILAWPTVASLEAPSSFSFLWGRKKIAVRLSPEQLLHTHQPSSPLSLRFAIPWRAGSFPTSGEVPSTFPPSHPCSAQWAATRSPPPNLLPFSHTPQNLFPLFHPPDPFPTLPPPAPPGLSPP